MDLKAQIAPKGLEFKSSDFVISDKYASILTVVLNITITPLSLLLYIRLPQRQFSMHLY